MDKDSIFNFNQAFQNFQVCFHESANRTRQQLKKCNIKVVVDYDYTESMPLPTYLNSRYLAHILNIANHEPFVVMKSNINPAKEIPLKGRMLLYGICELFNCQIMLFSTSKKATIIAPMGRLSYDLPRYYVLEHKDSYAIKTRYYCLKSYGKHKASTHKVKPYDGIVALKYQKGEAKEKLQGHRLGKGIDDLTLRLIKEKSFELYDLKWNNYVKKQGKNATVEAFRKTLSTKQLPTGVTAEVKAEVEKMLKEGDIPDKSESDIPKSGMWMKSKVATLVRANKLSVDGLLEEYLGKSQTDMDVNTTENEDEVESNVEQLDQEDFQAPTSRPVRRQIVTTGP